jgi:hypothetical protein
MFLVAAVRESNTVTAPERPTRLDPAERNVPADIEVFGAGPRFLQQDRGGYRPLTTN